MNNSKRFFIKLKPNKSLWLVIPFVIMTIILVIVPLAMILISSFLPTSAGGIDENWNFIDSFIWEKIFKSLYIAILSTIFTILIAYPFAYFLSFGTSKTFKAIVILVVTAPIWTSFLVKLIGLKTFFDVCYGYSNATYGDIFTIIGLTYLYIPFMILPLYSVLEDMPKNLIYASQDLGRSSFSTFFRIVIPYSKNALYSGITMVFLPAMTTVAVPQFLNNSNDGALIGDIIVEEGQMANQSDIAKARASSLSLIVSAIMFIVYGAMVGIPKLYTKIKRRKNV